MTRLQRAVHAGLWPILAALLAMVVVGGFAVRIQTADAIASAHLAAEQR